MKWIGQHIWDFISRFRSDVYLEDVSTGTIASGGNLGLDSNNKIVKDSGLGVTDLHSVGVDGANNQLLTDDGDGTITSEANLTFDGDNFTIESATSQKPVVEIKNTNSDNKASQLQLTKDKGAAGADGDTIGIITFAGDNTAQEQIDFAEIRAHVSEADDTDEAGKLTLSVAESDGLNTGLAPGLILEGEHATDGQVDVTIANGAASTTTVAGNLLVNGTTHSFSSSTASRPLVQIRNNANDTNAGSLQFYKNRGASAVNGDKVGSIDFYGENDAEEVINYGNIIVQALEVDDTDEAGKMSFKIAESNGTATGLTTGLLIEGSDNTTDGEVNVTIAAGAASTTTVAGDLTVIGDVIMMANLPTSDPSNAGQLWNDSNTLKISAG